MEGVPTAMYKGLRGYWKRRRYVKLNGSRGGSRRSKVELGSSRRRKRFWKIRVKAKLRILPSPKKFFVWLRDAYVKMMMGFANSRVVSAGYGGSMGDQGMAAFGKRRIKEYDEKMIIEIYKSMMMAQGQLVPREAGKISSSHYLSAAK